MLGHTSFVNGIVLVWQGGRVYGLRRTFQNLISNRRLVLSRFGEGGNFAGEHQTTASEDG